MKSIERRFAARGVLRGGLLLLRARDALDMVRRCREEGIEVLALDSFKLTEQTTQPLMEQSVDLSTPDTRDAWAKAEAFLDARADADLHFEVVIGA